MPTNHFSLPEKGLTISVDPELKLAGKTYFYERANGSIICVEAFEAWGLHKNPKEFKQVGVSSGQIFNEARKNLRHVFNTQGVEAAQELLREAERKELEAARGHFETPPNAEKMGPGRDYIK